MKLEFKDAMSAQMKLAGRYFLTGLGFVCLGAGVGALSIALGWWVMLAFWGLFMITACWKIAGAQMRIDGEAAFKAEQQRRAIRQNK